MRLITTMAVWALLSCGQRSPEAAAGPDASLHGSRPEVAQPLPAFRAVAQDGTPRDRAALVGKPTALWFYPMANTPG